MSDDSISSALSCIYIEGCVVSSAAVATMASRLGIKFSPINKVLEESGRIGFQYGGAWWTVGTWILDASVTGMYG